MPMRAKRDRWLLCRTEQVMFIGESVRRSMAFASDPAPGGNWFVTAWKLHELRVQTVNRALQPGRGRPATSKRRARGASRRMPAFGAVTTDRKQRQMNPLSQLR